MAGDLVTPGASEGAAEGGRIVIGTRGSKLALWQAQAAKAAIEDAFPQVVCEVKVISTKGDRVLDVPLEAIGDKGLFTKELEVALLAGEVDLCVHSMKDLPAELPAGCTIGAMLARADARDVLVCGPRIAGAHTLAELPADTRLGTGSQRRTAQLRARYPQVKPLPMRGNVDTRLRKAAGDDYDGAILAAAGIMRLEAAEAITAFLPLDDMIPAVGQGAVGIEVREGDERMAAVCLAIGDAATETCVSLERAVLAALEGGCQAPIGVHARHEEGRLVVDATVLAPDGSREARTCREFDADADVPAAAAQVVEELEVRGARDILALIDRAPSAVSASEGARR